MNFDYFILLMIFLIPLGINAQLNETKYLFEEKSLDFNVLSRIYLKEDGRYIKKETGMPLDSGKLFSIEKRLYFLSDLESDKESILKARIFKRGKLLKTNYSDIRVNIFKNGEKNNTVLCHFKLINDSKNISKKCFLEPCMLTVDEILKYERLELILEQLEAQFVRLNLDTEELNLAKTFLLKVGVAGNMLSILDRRYMRKFRILKSGFIIELELLYIKNESIQNLPQIIYLENYIIN